MTPFQLLASFLFGFGTAVIVFVLAAWSIEEKPKSKSAKNYKDEVNYFLELDEHEQKITA